MDSRINQLKFWRAPIVGAIATPIFMWQALVATGAERGSDAVMLLVYPFSLASLVYQAGSNVLAVQRFFIMLAITLAIVQLPLYGFVIAYANLRRTWYWMVPKFIILIHAVIFGSVIASGLILGG